MLTSLLICDFAIIERTELALHNGMTSLTGETGAGKSILLGALELVLGSRANSNHIRQGADKAQITASFDVQALPNVSLWLQANDLEADGECHIRRIVTRDGRSRGYINGTPCPIALLKALGEMLVSIHGQHEHQTLTHKETQQKLLDRFANNGSLLTQLRSIQKAWQQADSDYHRLKNNQDERLQRIDMLRYQLQELEAVDLAPEKIQALTDEHTRLANAEQLLLKSQQALALLYDEETSAYSLLSHSIRALDDVHNMAPELSEAVEMVNSALIQCDEAASSLRHFLDNDTLDPNRLSVIEQQLAILHDLSRKHRIEPIELAELFQTLQNELEEITGSDEQLDKLQQQLALRREEYMKIAQRLSENRHRAAKKLAKQVTQSMQLLGMANGQFEVDIQPVATDNLSPTGLDQITFLVSANAGHKAQALSKVASGGELSRISLAIQIILSKYNPVATMIFDEVDTGIGGGIAETVGDHLRRLGDDCQVLSVTHLPQVAAQAHHHIKVEKQQKAKKTQTTLHYLTAEARIEEIARMLGGKEITENTLRHAEEMLTL